MLTDKLLVPYRELGIFAITLERLVQTDVRVWFSVLILVSLRFYVALVIAYP